MTTIIYNGTIYLKRDTFTEALVISDGRIVKTGTSAELLDAVSRNTEKIDAGGALVLPAFRDSHLHLMWVGRRAAGIDCVGYASIEELIGRGREIIARLKPAAGTWIQGAGLNPDRFSAGEKRDPRREDMDKISTEFPVIVSRHCGHTIFCNSLALKLAGISETAPPIAGGTVEKDANGRPTGVLRENANALVRACIPAPSADDMKGYLRLAMKKALSLGISACGSYDTDGHDFDTVCGVYRDLYDEARQAGRPLPRVSMQCGISARDDLLDALLRRHADGRSLWSDPCWGTFLKTQSVKLFADGTLGGQTAWMRQPYRDNPRTSGFPMMDQERFEHFVRKAAADGMQVLVHAIGDAGIDAVLRAFETVTAPGENPLRHGIIHCQVTSPDLLERMARNKILALVQPAFLADDIHILESRVGPELAATSYAWGSMRRMDIPTSYGTDAPVSPLDPLFGIEWAVLRRDSEDPPRMAFNTRECVDVYTAVDAYTAGAAFSSFDENLCGRIQPGAYADLVFLDRNIFTIPPEDIHKARVLRTVCAGVTVFE